jgi:hypothetical protein
VTQLPNHNLFLMDTAKRRTSLTSVDFIYSRPLLSVDQRYVSFRAKDDDSFWLYVIDLMHPNLPKRIELPGDALVWNEMYIPAYFETYWAVDAWNPRDNTLLYKDANPLFLLDGITGDALFLLDAATGEVTTVIEAIPGMELSMPRWVCREDA